jgi:hypothetical protein
MGVKTGSGAHPAFYPVGTRDSFPGGKALGLEADHSSPSSAEVKNVFSYISILQYAFMAFSVGAQEDYRLSEQVRTNK